MRSRRKAREAALQALYQCDTLGNESDDDLDLYFEIFQPEIECAPSNPHFVFARELIQGVLRFRDSIDEQITNAAVHWPVARMCRVDRNIIRLGVFEIGFRDDIPPSVAINEAIEIAKRFGTGDSPHFVNGVLDQVLHKTDRCSEWVAAARSAAELKAA